MLISLAFLAGGGFLALHALATPGVLLDGPNQGFVLATPIGLLLGAAFAALSTREGQGRPHWAPPGRCGLPCWWPWRPGACCRWPRCRRSTIPPLWSPARERWCCWACPAVALYALGNVALPGPLPPPAVAAAAGVAAGFLLLAEAMVAVAFARNWQATWWEWHLLMFTPSHRGRDRRREWREERFSDLYLDDTVAGKREVSVVFADLAGFTAFSEQRDPREVSSMLNAYFEAAIPPVVEGEGGEIDRVMGDAIMASFNRRGDQADHPERAARAALALRDATEAVASDNPGWPRFRIGVNTGEAMTGVLGAHGGRSYTVIGDAVNVAARLETAAPVGSVAVSAETLERLSGADAEPLGALSVKGRERPVQAFRLRAVDAK